jgi:hypothetical protein
MLIELSTRNELRYLPAVATSPRATHPITTITTITTTHISTITTMGQ